MFQNLINKFVAWFYNKLEAEKVRRVAVLRAEQDAKRDEMQRKNSAYLLKALQEKQDKCKHLKGGKITTHKDYAVYQHTLPTGVTFIKCQLCAKMWTTALGNWKEGLEMTWNSTNTASGSEVVLSVKDRERPVDTSDPKLFPQETNYEPLAPFASKGYVKLWADKLKKLNRRKKGLK